MRGRAAHHEYRFTRERKFPHRMIDLFGDRLRPGTFVQPRKLVEREPHFPVVGAQRLHGPRPGKHHQRCVRPERARFAHEMPKLGAENLDLKSTKNPTPPPPRAITPDAKNPRQTPRSTTPLRFKFSEH